MNLLFVCSRNQWRSPTAEWLYANDPRCDVRSGGTSKRARHTVSIRDIRWADKVVAMETKHKSRLKATFRQELAYTQIHVLDIPDNYRYQDPELIELLQASIDPLLE